MPSPSAPNAPCPQQRTHARFEVARTQLELAELAQARGDLVGATTWLTEAAQALALMAVSRYDERIAALRAALPATSARDAVG